MTAEECVKNGGHCFVDETDIRTWGDDPNYLRRIRVCKHCKYTETQEWRNDDAGQIHA